MKQALRDASHAPPAIRVNEFHFSYKSVDAVRGISFEVQPGELFGLIGPDGAGKTTTFRALATLFPVEEGMLQLAGLDVATEFRALRKRIGYMPQRFSIYPDLTVRENLLFFASLFGVPEKERPERLRSLFAFSNLEPFKDRQARNLSGGMKQKLALSCTLIHQPEILILDEPTTGVDPVSREEFWHILHELKQDGVTILVSTPYMDEADLCDRVAIMNRGRILAIDRPANLPSLFPGRLYEIETRSPVALAKRLRVLPSVKEVHTFGDRVHFTAQESGSESDVRAQVLTVTEEDEVVKTVPPSLEDVFIYLMREQHEEA